ncbi:MAG: hypothetical protein EOP00_29925, partial [Pedobacter sp.]
MPNHNLVIILGPTASGKTKLAVNMAEELNGEIMSADSRQVFKGMDIGTGKDLSEYNCNGKQIPYHLIDIREAGEKYNVNSFKEDFYQVFTDIHNRDSLPILCGGTGMYIHSILQNHNLTSVPINNELRAKYELYTKDNLQQILDLYPQQLRENADYSSSKRLIRAIEIAEYLKHNVLINIDRPTLNAVVIGLQSDVDLRRERVLKRLDLRLNNGLIEEVKSLLKKGRRMSTVSPVARIAGRINSREILFRKPKS